MGVPQLLYSLPLILLICTVPAQPNEGKVRDAGRTRLETRTPKGASTYATGLQNSLINLRAGSIPGPARSHPKQHTLEKRQQKPCRLKSVVLSINDLGMGYETEESINFQYCTGRCPISPKICPYPRRNYDQVFSFLLRHSKKPTVGESCCRPVEFGNVGFMDNSYQWHVLEEVVAEACSCVG